MIKTSRIAFPILSFCRVVDQITICNLSQVVCGFSMLMRKEGAKQNPNGSVKEVDVGKAVSSLRKRAI